jgi:hypothetical protein
MILAGLGMGFTTEPASAHDGGTSVHVTRSLPVSAFHEFQEPIGARPRAGGRHLDTGRRASAGQVGPSDSASSHARRMNRHVDGSLGERSGNELDLPVP